MVLLTPRRKEREGNGAPVLAFSSIPDLTTHAQKNGTIFTRPEGLLLKPQQTKLEARNPKFETNPKKEKLRFKLPEVTVST
jgi:hypothetical protein